MKLRATLIFTLVALVVALSACGGGGGDSGTKQITVTGTEFKFDPSQISLQNGQKVRVTFQNKGTSAHNFAVPDLNVKTPDVAAGQSASVEFTPDRTGTFAFVCTIAGHEQAGMVGKLTVQ